MNSIRLLPVKTSLLNAFGMSSQRVRNFKLQRGPTRAAARDSGPSDDCCRLANIKPGVQVDVVLKEDQRGGKLTRGIVDQLLTNSTFHPRGIKVRLRGGLVGRVQKILSADTLPVNVESKLAANTSGTVGQPALLNKRRDDLRIQKSGNESTEYGEWSELSLTDVRGPFAALGTLKSQLQNEQFGTPESILPTSSRSANSSLKSNPPEDGTILSEVSAAFQREEPGGTSRTERPSTLRRKEKFQRPVPSDATAQEMATKSKFFNPRGPGFSNESTLPVKTEIENASPLSEASTGSLLIDMEPIQVADEGPAGKSPDHIQLFVSNLSPEVTKGEFAEAMRGIPGVVRWKSITNQNGKSRGYGFCQVQSDAASAAVTAIRRLALHGKQLSAVVSATGAGIKPGEERQSIVPTVEEPGASVIGEGTRYNNNKDSGHQLAGSVDKRRASIGHRSNADEGPGIKGSRGEGSGTVFAGGEAKMKHKGARRYGGGDAELRKALEGFQVVDGKQRFRESVQQSSKEESSVAAPRHQSTFADEPASDTLASSVDSTEYRVSEIALRENPVPSGAAILAAMQQAALEKARIGKEQSRATRERGAARAPGGQQPAPLAADLDVPAEPIVARPEWAAEILSLRRQIAEIKKAAI